jgi:hypothetical protein
LTGSLVFGPTGFQTPVIPNIKTSYDGITFTPVAPVTSLSFDSSDVLWNITWRNTGIPWPIYISSVYELIDGEAFLQAGTIQGTVGTGGVQVLFSPTFRLPPSFAADIIGGPIGATVGRGAVSTTAATAIQCYNSAGAEISGVIHWSAIGL